MVWFTPELIDAVVCCIQHSRVSEPGNKETFHNGMTQATSHTNRVCGQKQMLHLRQSWTPSWEVQLLENSPKWNNVFARLRKDVQVGSEVWNDVTFTRQRIRWTKDSQSGSCIEASQQKDIDELEEIPVERNTRRSPLYPCNAYKVQKPYRTNKLGQSRTQFQCCYTFSRCASMAASPTIGDVKALNKQARELKSQPVKLQFWLLTGPLRIIGFPDASHLNNEDGSSQRGIAMFLAESRERSTKH